ncbi:MAG: chlorophyll a-b binding domain-containing protein, partial [bacterium]
MTAQTPLERALLQGVVPADAGVGSKSLPGDYGFDPLGLATKDLFPSVQKFLLKLLPPPLLLYNNAREEEEERQEEIPRPKALIIRDFREAEIRHGRLAMLAAVIWPLQELVDRAILPVE